MLRSWSASGLGLGLLGALFGCNAILGIESRELSELTCERYCEEMSTNCVGDFAAYPSATACVAVCERLIQSTEDLECRLEQATAAVDLADPATHCPSAALAGPVCGDPCETYCDLMASACGEDSPLGADRAACLSSCANAPRNASWTHQNPFHLDYDDSLECRLWHLTQSVQQPSLHCPHADGSTNCNGRAPCRQNGGACAGTCVGNCDGNCSSVDGDGFCQGSCDGTCFGECVGALCADP